MFGLFVFRKVALMLLFLVGFQVYRFLTMAVSPAKNDGAADDRVADEGDDGADPISFLRGGRCGRGVSIFRSSLL